MVAAGSAVVPRRPPYAENSCPYATFAPNVVSRAYRGTRNLRAVQTLLGHASIATTERYTAVDDSEIRAAMVAAIGD
jgi:hypothetical protein